MSSGCSVICSLLIAKLIESAMSSSKLECNKDYISMLSALGTFAKK
jgi:hypothetical protein